ncbi:YfbM family protein [Streptomyces sp. CT34]|uniref:YfbM family protein n=1 Tax=Streptomyces sp. CT34 TaxID=1553907 RepID=UPI0005BB3027|nr:YfbM family protein [Streptomyces sp. CT34]
MGVSISFISATMEELDRAENDPSWAGEYIYELYDSDDLSMPDRPHGGPDKAWAGLQFLLDETDVEIEFLMDGFQILEDGTLFGWSAEQIGSLARQLRATPWERLAVHYDPEQMMTEEVYPNTWRFDPEGELDWLERSYEELVTFFIEAAESGYGAFMSFSF